MACEMADEMAIEMAIGIAGGSVTTGIEQRFCKDCGHWAEHGRGSGDVTTGAGDGSVETGTGDVLGGR